MQSKLNIS